MASHLKSLIFVFNLLLITFSHVSVATSRSLLQAKTYDYVDYTPTTTTTTTYTYYTYKKKTNTTAIVIGVLASLFFLASIAFGVYSIFRHKAKIAAAIAAASTPAAGNTPNNQWPNIPKEEVPINPQPTHMNP